MTDHSAKNEDAKPWDKDNPKSDKESKHLTPAQKGAAKRMAKEAGRPYPNLVDNMRVAANAKKKAEKE